MSHLGQEFGLFAVLCEKKKSSSNLRFALAFPISYAFSQWQTTAEKGEANVWSVIGM